MRDSKTLVLAFALIAVGAIGIAIASAIGGGSRGGTFASEGQRIYFTGASSSRPIPRTAAGGGMMGYRMSGAMSCVDCHAEDGRGGRLGMMFGDVEIPDIRYSALTAAKSEGGTTEPGWTETDIVRAIRDGIEPNGQRLKSPMPRFDMTDAEMSSVITYLKELSSR
jgi:mono/diheme cytochrome c family protein